MLPLSNLGLHSKEQQWGRVNTKSYQEKQYLKRLSTYVWFFNHIKFSINLKIRKRTHLCIQCLYNTILHQWFGGVCHPFLWWFISLNSNFQENVQEVCFCKLQNSWFWWFLKFLRGNLFFYVFLFRNMNTLSLQEFAAEAVAMNRIFSEASAIDEPDAHYDEFQNNIKPRLFGLSPPSNSVLARRRAASSKSHLQNPVNRDVEKSGL